MKIWDYFDREVGRRPNCIKKIAKAIGKLLLCSSGIVFILALQASRSELLVAFMKEKVF